MGLFDKLFGRQPMQASGGAFQTLTAYRPTFSKWDGRLYENELVRAAIDAKARHISKLSVEITGAAKPKLRTLLRTAPNAFQTWGQFLYRTSTILDMQGTCFIVPVLDEFGDVNGFFSVLPSSCEVVEAMGEAYLRYTFSTGKKAAIELSACGILTRHQYEDDLFGSNGSALKQTMELISMQNQGIAEGIKNSATYRFTAKVTNFMKPDDLARERQRFNRENLEGEGGGVLLFPNTFDDIKQIQSSPYVANQEQMKLIQTNVFNYFGVNEDALQNKLSGDSWSAFYEGAIEPFAIQLSDVLTRMVFTGREQNGGNAIFFAANRLQYMSNNEKLNVSAQMADRGIMNRDEIRAIWNLPPLPNGEGQAYIVRGEYKNANETNDRESDPDAGEE